MINRYMYGCDTIWLKTLKYVIFMSELRTNGF